MTDIERIKLELELQAEQIRELARLFRQLKQMVGYGFIAIAFTLVAIAT